MALTDLRRAEMIEALLRGPQSAQPPNVDRQNKAELARCIRQALASPGPAREQMESALAEVRAARR